MITFNRRARTKQLEHNVNRFQDKQDLIVTYYARGKDKPSSFITSAMHIVADRDTPTRQWTRVAPPSAFPLSDIN